MENILLLRHLGKSDLMVSSIGLGCWQFSKGRGFDGKYWTILDDKEIRNIVSVSLEGGVNWFDTAESYGRGESEKALSRALKILGKSSEDVVIATKWMPLFKTAKSIIKTIDKRLENLNNYRIDLHQVHHPWSFSTAKAEMRAMAQLVESQKIRYVGVSNFSAKKIKIAQNELSRYGLNLVSNQVKYNLLDRKIETNGILDTAKELGISIIAYSPLAQGLLTGKFHEDPNLIRKRSGPRKHMRAFKPKGLEKSRIVINALKELAEKYHVTPSQVALNWLINFHGNTVVAIPGATKIDQAKDNTGSMKFKLIKEELDYLDKVSSPFKRKTE